jgi:hypothetical protein
MPIFPGPVSHNNANAPILDATGNQIKGFGFFDNTTERNALSTNLQVDGFLAIVGTTAYVFQGGTWTDANNWTEVGSGSGLDNVVEDLTPQLGGDLDVNGQSIVSVSNGDIIFTPNGTGHINLDGVVEFKRFPAASPPTAFAGGMYADDDDNLFFGVT